MYKRKYLEHVYDVVNSFPWTPQTLSIPIYYLNNIGDTVTAALFINQNQFIRYVSITTSCK